MFKERKLLSAKLFLENNRVTGREIWEKISLNGRKLPNRFLFVRLKKYVGDFLTNKALEPRMIEILWYKRSRKDNPLMANSRFREGEF